MYGYNKAENEFGTLLANQGLPVISVTKVGRTFHVKMDANVDTTVVENVNLGRRRLRLIGMDAGRELRTGMAVLVAEFAPTF